MYSIISSKDLYCQEKSCKISKIFLLFLGNSQNQSAPWLEICHVSSSAARGNQGVKPRVLQHALARQQPRRRRVQGLIGSEKVQMKIEGLRAVCFSRRALSKNESGVRWC